MDACTKDFWVIIEVDTGQESGLWVGGPFDKRSLKGLQPDSWKRSRTGSNFTKDRKAASGLCLVPYVGRLRNQERHCLGIKAVLLALSLHYLSGPCRWRVGNRGIQKRASRKKWFACGHSERTCLENSDPPGSWTKTTLPPTTRPNFTASKQKALGTCNSEVIMGLVDFLAFLLSTCISWQMVELS